MNGVQRILTGATGGLLAVLTKYLAQDHNFISHWANASDPRFFDIVLGYAILTPILLFLGGAVAGFSDEINKLKLLAMGVAAPALITTMAGGAVPPAPQVPHSVGPAGWHFLLSPVNTALAADTYPRIAQATAIQKGVEAYFGAGKGETRYWVIVGSFKDKLQAEARASTINQEAPSMNTFVGKRMPNNEFYPVIVGDFLPLGDATRLRDVAAELSALKGHHQPYLSAFPDRRP